MPKLWTDTLGDKHEKTPTIRDAGCCNGEVKNASMRRLSSDVYVLLGLLKAVEEDFFVVFYRGISCYKYGSLLKMVSFHLIYSCPELLNKLID